MTLNHHAPFLPALLAFFVLAAGLLAPSASALGASSSPTPPTQPAGGPGGADYAYTAVERASTGSSARDALLFWPKGISRDTSLPVVVFTHGWGAMTPDHYLAWIEHLARKGAIVVFPRYQDSLRVPAAAFTDNAVAGVRAALAWLDKNKSTAPRPDPARWATVGHSAGGVLAANLAVALPAAGLPTPKAVMSVEPGVTRGERGTLLPLADLGKIAPSTLLLAIVGEDDDLVGDADARRIYQESTAVPAAQKDLIQLRSDAHGAPALQATHRAPAAPLPGYEPPQRREPKGFVKKRIAKKASERLAERGLHLENSSREPAVTDALDHFGTWKLFDALTTAAFTGQNRDLALGGSAAQLDMGKWSDGTPVKPMVRLTP